MANNLILIIASSQATVLYQAEWYREAFVSELLADMPYKPTPGTGAFRIWSVAWNEHQIQAMDTVARLLGDNAKIRWQSVSTSRNEGKYYRN